MKRLSSLSISLLSSLTLLSIAASPASAWDVTLDGRID